MSRSLGRDIRPRAMASICCSPPESVPAFWFRRSFNLGKSVKQCAKSSASAPSRRL